MSAHSCARPSTWFRWHRAILRPGCQVLDVACGSGRHAIAAAALGCSVVAVDRQASRLEEGKGRAEARGLHDIRWEHLDLERNPLPPPPPATFDVIMGFNYLDRVRMKDFVAAVKPGGYLLYETYLEGQTAFGWGPQSADHLLKPGELFTLVRPLAVEHGREVVETVDSRTAAIASVLARRDPPRKSA